MTRALLEGRRRNGCELLRALTRLSPQQIERLERFLTTAAAISPAVSDELRAETTRRAIAHLEKREPLPPGASILVAECEAAVVEVLTARGFKVAGCTVDEVEAARCRETGIDVQVADASFTTFVDGSFDVIWCQRALVRSMFPSFTLHEFRRLLRPGGLLYVEVASLEVLRAPEYRSTLLDREGWVELLEYGRFEVFDRLVFAIDLGGGGERRSTVHWCFYCRSVRKRVSAPTEPKRVPLVAPSVDDEAITVDSTSPAARPLYVAMPMGDGSGWGLCGIYITRELARLAPIRLITDSMAAVWPLQAREFERLLVSHQGNAVKEAHRKRLTWEKMEHNSEGELQVAAPVLQASFGEGRYLYNVRGEFNVGYTFFEYNANVFSPQTIERMRRDHHVVTCGSEWNSEFLRERGFEDVETVIQGVDPTRFEPSEIPRQYLKDRFVIFSGGKFEFRKGQDLVLRAFKVLAERYADVMLVAAWYNPFDMTLMCQSPYIRFSPVGADYASIMQKTLYNNGIDARRVMILPHMMNVQMAEVYKNTDVGLFPNRCEGGTNLVMMEYMACGKPVVATFSTGHRDILTPLNALLLRSFPSKVSVRFNEQEIGLWDEPDIDEIVAQLDQAYHSRSVLRAIGRQAGEHMKQFTWAATAEHFLRIFRTRGAL